MSPSPSRRDAGARGSAARSLKIIFATIAVAHTQASPDDQSVTLFLSGDVMTGRGIDQIMPVSNDPELHESYVKNAEMYVELAEELSGPIPRSVDTSYIWGEALEVLDRESPHLRAINLETSVTTSDDYWPGKGIHYRMHPANVDAMQAANIDICSLANNHVLDWGFKGLKETLRALDAAGLEAVGAGENLQEAAEPAVVKIEGAKGRLLFFACGFRSSGIPPTWAAGAEQPGVYLIQDPRDEGLEALTTHIRERATPDDIVIVSIHWGGNWGYDIPKEHRNFAHGLIDAGVDVVHGHSSHHVMGIEVYRDRPILYGCGDLITDYEGIRSHGSFRGDLSLMYFPKIDLRSGKLVQLRMTPMQIRQFQLHRASAENARWLAELLNREGDSLGTSVKVEADNTLVLQW